MGRHYTIRHFPDKSDTGEHTLPGIGRILSGHALFGLIETVYIMEKKTGRPGNDIGEIIIRDKTRK